MDNDVALGDLITYFKNTVCMINGRPAYVIRISDDKEFFYKDLLSNENRVMEFNPKKIKAPDARLGMININGVAYYMQRRPVRRYQMGITKENCVIHGLDGVDYRNAGLNNEALNRIDSSEVANALMGDYPSFADALERVKTFGGVVAFDRQFAIDENRRIYYKKAVVGKVPRMVTSAEHIQFTEGFEYLSCVVNGITHEKIARSIAN